jgi:hypothetical protein
LSHPGPSTKRTIDHHLNCFLIIWLSNLSTLSVPDEGYSRNASCALNLISTFSLYYTNQSLKYSFVISCYSIFILWFRVTQSLFCGFVLLNLYFVISCYSIFILWSRVTQSLFCDFVLLNLYFVISCYSIFILWFRVTQSLFVISCYSIFILWFHVTQSLFCDFVLLNLYFVISCYSIFILLCSALYIIVFLFVRIRLFSQLHCPSFN